MAENGLYPKSCIVWDKKHGVQNLDRFAKRHEFILYAGPFGGEPTLDTDVWEEARDYQAPHPTVKPTSLVKRAIGHGCSLGEIVLDPFSGSGTTLVAAELSGRLCYGMEIEPKYVAVTLERMADMGLTPQLAQVQ